MFASVTLSDLLLLRKNVGVAGRGISDIAGQAINMKMFFNRSSMLVERISRPSTESTPVRLLTLSSLLLPLWIRPSSTTWLTVNIWIVAGTMIN